MGLCWDLGWGSEGFVFLSWGFGLGIEGYEDDLQR